ncbi:MAG TPA: ABC transporter ATP-binding protein [Anaerolineae bacterium]|nr:ABC transporter ATP-binding protein [Anaerolineae bacterium]
MEVVLETIGLTRHFGQVTAADSVSVHVRMGEWVSIVGPNGAGKTTFLNLVTGYVKPERGQILYMGNDITGLPPRDVTRLGIARSFQVPQLYTDLTVMENVLIALAAQAGCGLDFWNSLRRDGWLASALETLNHFGLRRYANRPAKELPEGGRKLLDIALAFALRPQLLLMDEPTSGVSRQEKFDVMDTLVEVLRPTDVTTLFVEHDMDIVRQYAQRVLVFHEGRLIADGDPQVVLAGVDNLPS